MSTSYDITSAPHRTVDPFGKMYSYKWRHIPTGKTGMAEQNFNNEADFFKTLDRWNSQQPGVWVYTSHPFI